MSRYFSASDVRSEALLSRTVAVIGYGNQGRAHALNLRDSGARVIVGLYKGSPSAEVARRDGFEPVETDVAVRESRIVMLATPDMKMAEIFEASVAPALAERACVLFAHGFNIVYGLIEPPDGVDVALVSPKGAGAGVRRRFEEGSGVPALVGVHQDATGSAMEVALAYAWGLGCARSVLMETTFREETETDLFGEQAVLCGGIPALLNAGFETLVQAGYAPELAYFECVHEAKIIVDLIYERGLAGMRRAISDTAQWGGLSAGGGVVGDASRASMKRILDEVRSGAFAQDWLGESRNGYRELGRLRAEEAALPLEAAGEELRARLAAGAPSAG